MSIDYFIYNFDGPLPSETAMQDRGFFPPPLGDVAAVKKSISQYAPEILWSDTDLLSGHAADQDYRIDFWLQSSAQGLVATITVHPYGTAAAEPIIRKFCVPNGWHVFNPQSGEWVDPTDL